MRPAMIPWLGVPYSAGVVLIMTASLIVLFGHNPVYLIILGPVWVALVALVRHDYHALRVLDLWSRNATGDDPMAGCAVQCGRRADHDGLAHRPLRAQSGLPDHPRAGLGRPGRAGAARLSRIA